MTKFISESSNFEFRWSLERYHQLIEMGLLTELDKVELLFGKNTKRTI